jgi:hypothetical protein
MEDLGRRNPGLKPLSICGHQRPKAEALGYLEATATATTTTKAKAIGFLVEKGQAEVVG